MILALSHLLPLNGNNNMSRLLSFIVIFLFSVSTFAQPTQTQVETVAGKKYFVHIVKQGNTLFGIHQLYGVSVEEILQANEGVSDNLMLGQKVLIPISLSNEKFYGKHTVQKGETLYGISKQYDCSVQDLKNINVGLGEGVSIGQVIVVPLQDTKEAIKSEIQQAEPVQKSEPVARKEQYAVSYEDSIITHVVLKHETLYSIAKRYMVSTDTIVEINNLSSFKIRKDDVLKIPVKRVNYDIVEKDLNDLNKTDTVHFSSISTTYKDMYTVAIMLPLMLDKNESVMNQAMRLGQAREMFQTTKISFDFYQGFMLAMDSLKQAGLNVKVLVYDTKKDTSVIAGLMNKEEFKEVDLVVGPLFEHTIRYATKRCAEKQIRIVLPFNTDEKNLYNNPFVFKSVASDMTLMDGTVDYIVQHHAQHNVILVKPINQSDLALYERVRERFNEKIKAVKNPYNLKIVEASQGSTSGRELNAYVKSDTVNVFIIPSNDLTFVSGAMSRLNKVMNLNPYKSDFKVVTFGLEEWNKFEDLDVKYRNRLNQHYASYRYVDYNDPEGVEFVKAYRSHNGVDPNVYATQGFDIGMYFVSSLYLYGTNFDSALDFYRMNLVQNNFSFQPILPQSGQENQRVCIIKYDNYKLVPMQK
jgi:LysM repeat protein